MIIGTRTSSRIRRVRELQKAQRLTVRELRKAERLTVRELQKAQRHTNEKTRNIVQQAVCMVIRARWVKSWVVAQVQQIARRSAQPTKIVQLLLLWEVV